MTTFVLVHGAWHGGWCFRRVADRLTAHGHKVFTPTMTGVGERSHLLRPGIGLDVHVTDIVNVFKWEGLSDVVLLGHSYGGLVISLVAEQVEKSLRSLVYLDAFVPRDGDCMREMTSPASRARIDEGGKESGEVFVPPIPASVFKVNAKDAAWVDSLCTPHPYKTMVDRARITGAAERVAKKTYVFSEQYGSPAFKGYYEALKGDPAWRTVSIPCGHDIMLDMPDELTQILEEAA